MSGSVLVTGAGGFIGAHLLNRSRYVESMRPFFLRRETIDGIDFEAVNTVVHLGGIAHRMDEPSGEIYFEVNRDLTASFAERARAAGVKHFIFVSTVKVYGDRRTIVSETDAPEPDDDYSKSKWEGEKAVRALESRDFVVSVVRPPLVYGPGAAGNVARLVSLLQRGLPLPFAGIQNKRSMVFVENLVALIDRVIELRASGVFVAGDMAPLSTTEMIDGLGRGMTRTPRLFKLPPLFVAGVRLVQPALIERLFGTFVVENAGTNKRLNFSPSISSDEGLRRTAEAYRSRS